MRYKMLATDFDLTLSRQDQSVSERNQRAIREAEEAGLRVVLASGRLPAAARTIFPYFSPDTPAVLCNGGILYLPRTDEILWENTLPEEEALALMDWFSRRTDGVCIVWCRDRIYASALNELSQQYCQRRRLPVHPLSSPKALAKAGVSKVLYYAPTEEMQSAAAAFAAHPPVQVSYFPSGPDILELVSFGVNKGAGLLRCAEYLGISPTEIAAVGDSGNDVDMLRTAAFPVAVDNAVPEVKALAQRIVPSCEDDGVAVLLAELLRE